MNIINFTITPSVNVITIPSSTQLLKKDKGDEKSFKMIDLFTDQDGDVNVNQMLEYCDGHFNDILFVSPQDPTMKKPHFYIGAENEELLDIAREVLIFTRATSIKTFICERYMYTKKMYDALKKCLIDYYGIPIYIADEIGHYIYPEYNFKCMTHAVMVSGTLSTCDTGDDAPCADFAVSTQDGGIFACITCAIAKPRGKNLVYSMQDGISVATILEHVDSDEHVESFFTVVRKMFK
jgi:hypothetical protein